MKLTKFDRRGGAILGYAMAIGTHDDEQVIIMSPSKKALAEAAHRLVGMEVDFNQVQHVELRAAASAKPKEAA